MIWYTYVLQNVYTIRLVITPSPHTIAVFIVGVVARTLKLGSHSNFWVHNAVLLTTVTTLDSRSPELKTKHLFPLTNISAFPCPRVPSNHHTTLCSCEFDFFFNNFIYFWLCWVFIAVRAFLQLRWAGRSAAVVSRVQQLWFPGSRAQDQAVAHGPTSSSACRIFQDLGSDPCLLRWQANSLPLSHQGNPESEGFRFSV